MNAYVKTAIEDATRKVSEDLQAKLPGIVSEAIEATLVRLGLDVEEPLEVQRDMQHLRAWRKSSETIKDKAILAMVGVLVTGTLGALWLGIKEFMNR